MGARPKAASLLKLCGYLAPEVIPATWFYPSAGRADATWAAAKDGLPRGPWEVKEAFEAIRDFGLGRVDQQGLKVHRLTQAILRDYTADDHVVYQDLVVRMLVTVAPGGTDDPADWPQWARLVPHLLTVPVASAPTAFRPLACSAARYLIVSGQTRAALDLAGRLHATWAAELGPDHPDTLTAAEQRGHALRDIGNEARSLEVNRDTYERRRLVLGDDDPATLMSANNLAASLYALGRYKETLSILQDTYERRRRVLGEDHRETLLSASTVGTTLGTLGRLQEALEFQQNAYEGRRRALGADHPDTLLTLFNVAAALHKLGQLREALELGQDGLERYRRVLGEDHPGTLEADTLHMESLYGQVLLGLGRPRDALPYNKDVYDRRSRTLGADHADTGQAAEIFARNLEFLGRKAEALQLRMRMSRGRRKA